MQTFRHALHALIQVQMVVIQQSGKKETKRERLKVKIDRGVLQIEHKDRDNLPCQLLSY